MFLLVSVLSVIPNPLKLLVILMNVTYLLKVMQNFQPLSIMNMFQQPVLKCVQLAELCLDEQTGGRIASGLNDRLPNLDMLTSFAGCAGTVQRVRKYNS